MAKAPYASKGDSDSPLATRRNNADPVDISANSPGSQDFGPRNDYANPRQPSAPISEGRGATPPKEPGSATPPKAGS